MKDLFDHPSPLSHTDDPQTSYDAADKMIKSGKLSGQESLVLAAIKDFMYCGYRSNFTARELSDATNIDYHLIQRRKSGLEDKGRIKRTGKERNGYCVYELIK